MIIGGVFNSGVLAQPAEGATYDYAAATPPVLDAAARYEAFARAHGIALPALALQFALRHPAVSTVLVGARTADEITSDVESAAHSIPDAVWDLLDTE